MPPKTWPRPASSVTVVELQPHALSAYFEAGASTIIEGVFARHGVRMLMGRTLKSVKRPGIGCRATLDDGQVIAAELLLVCTGVKPNVGVSATDRALHSMPAFLSTTGCAPICRTSGPLATSRKRAASGGDKVVNGILPNAVEQGRIAGLDMASDAG